jgi:hypothetical protein
VIFFSSWGDSPTPLNRAGVPICIETITGEATCDLSRTKEIVTVCSVWVMGLG